MSFNDEGDQPDPLAVPQRTKEKPERRPEGATAAPPPPGRPDLDVEKVETSVDLTSKPFVGAELKAKQAKAERMTACIIKSSED